MAGEGYSAAAVGQVAEQASPVHQSVCHLRRKLSVSSGSLEGRPLLCTFEGLFGKIPIFLFSPPHVWPCVIFGLCHIITFVPSFPSSCLSPFLAVLVI